MTIVYGSQATIEESELPENASGTVTAVVGGTTLCSFAVPTKTPHCAATLPAGTYGPITATFVPSGEAYAGSSELCGTAQGRTGAERIHDHG